MNKKPRVLLLLWHPEDVVAGGFIRIKEFLPYISKETQITVIDNFPSLIHNKTLPINVRNYKIPGFLKFFYRVNYIIGRVLEWMYTTFSLIIIGMSELRTGNYDIIYGPTGDNPHIFIAGFVLKKLFPDKKLLLDVLNLEMPEGGTREYFRNFRNNNVGFLESLIRTYPLAFIIILEQKLIKSCDFVVTVSPYMKSIISKYYPKGKIDFTPSGVSIPNNISLKNKKTINGIYVGRHTKDKGIFDIIRVWGEVSQKIPNASLVTAGSCQKDIKILLDREIKEKGLEKKIIMKGLVSEDEKWKLLSSSKYFLHLAYFEPLVPVITILEALAAGLPVIMYDVTALNDYTYFRKHPAIFVVKNKDMEAVIKTILNLESLSKEQAYKIGIEARKLAQQFSWEEIAKKESNIIQQLCLT